MLAAGHGQVVCVKRAEEYRCSLGDWRVTVKDQTEHGIPQEELQGMEGASGLVTHLPNGASMVLREEGNDGHHLVASITWRGGSEVLSVVASTCIEALDKLRAGLEGMRFSSAVRKPSGTPHKHDEKPAEVPQRPKFKFKFPRVRNKRTGGVL